MNKAAIPQPNPIRGKITVYPYVLADIKARVEMGKEKYGTLLRTNNGRDALMDAYQELLDGCMYLRQLLLERDGE